MGCFTPPKHSFSCTSSLVLMGNFMWSTSPLCQWYLNVYCCVKPAQLLSKTPEHDVFGAKMSGAFFNGLTYGELLCIFFILWEFFTFLFLDLKKKRTYHNSHFLVLSCLVRLVCVCPCLSFICIYDLITFSICYPQFIWFSFRKKKHFKPHVHVGYDAIIISRIWKKK